MEGREKKEESSLPPDYVSLAQLQERWLKKKEERKQKKKQVEDIKVNDVNEKLEGGFLSDEKEKAGRKTDVIEKKGTGEEIIDGGFENGEGSKKKNMKNIFFGKKKYAKDDGKGKEMEKEKKRIEIKELETGDQCEGVGIFYGELKGVKDIASVSMVGALPRNGENRIGFRGGIRRNGNNRGCSFYKSKKEYEGRFNELKRSEGRLALEKKIGGEKGYGNKKWRERRRSGECKEGKNRLKESIDDVLEGNELELELEKKAEDEILKGFDEQCGLNEKERNGVGGQSNKGGTEGECLNDNRMALVEKVDHEVLVVEPVKNGEKGAVGKGYMRYGNWRGNFRERRRYARFGRFDNRQKTKPSVCGKMWVKKEEMSGADAAEVGLSGILADEEWLNSKHIN